jgi:hypothetical protein
MNELSTAITAMHTKQGGSSETADPASILSGPSRKEMCP